MTRRGLFALLPAPGVQPAASLAIPVHLLVDSRARFRKDVERLFWETVWEQALREFEKCGVHLAISKATGEIRRLPSNEPEFRGLERHALNMVVTNALQLAWDRARGLTGATTMYRGYHLSVVSADRAHPHQIPFLSVNTCVHELLHALMGDIFENRPGGWRGEAREWRIDSLATRLWLFNDGSAIREAAAGYVRKL